MPTPQVFLPSFAIAIVIAVSAVGADAGSARLEAEDEVLLRFSPEIGRTYRYSYSVNLDKTTFGKTSNERIDALFLLHILGRERESYQTRWRVIHGGDNLKAEVMDRIKAQAAQSAPYEISERYVFRPDEGQSLFFPREKLRVRAAWKGRPRFNFADLSTVNPLHLNCEYRLMGVVKTPTGRIAVIKGIPLEMSFRVPLEVGQLGIRCDENGTVVQLRNGTETEARLKVGDAIISINGKACPTSSSRMRLAEGFIEPLNNLGSNVTLTVQRGSARFETKLPKISATLGLCHVEIVNLQKDVEFHLEKGIVLSDITRAKLSLRYDLQGKDSFLDDYRGGPAPDRVRSSPMPPRLYSYEWRMLLEDEATAMSGTRKK